MIQTKRPEVEIEGKKCSNHVQWSLAAAVSSNVTMCHGEVTMFRDSRKSPCFFDAATNNRIKKDMYHSVSSHMAYQMYQTFRTYRSISLSFAFEASCRHGLLAAEIQAFDSLGAKRVGMTPVSGGSETASSASTQNSARIQNNVLFDKHVFSPSQRFKVIKVAGIIRCIEHTVYCAYTYKYIYIVYIYILLSYLHIQVRFMVYYMYIILM